MKMEKIICEQCGNKFEKSVKEINRSIKLNRKQYCSRSCAGKNLANIARLNEMRSNDTSHMNSANRKDEYSLFRTHLRRAKKRHKKVTITLEDLKEQWKLQNGICIYSKVELKPSSYRKENDPIYTMSLDRIDSTKGYIPGNIQFISIAMNYLKHKMTHEKMLEIIKILNMGVT